MVGEIWDGVDLGEECSRLGDLHVQRLGQVRNEGRPDCLECREQGWRRGVRYEKQAQVRSGRSECQKLLGSDLSQFTFLDNPTGRKIILSAGCLL